MRSTLVQASVHAADFDPGSVISNVRTLGLAALAVVLIFISLVLVTGTGGRGNVRKAWNGTFASIIALLPAVIGAGIGALAFGIEFWGWFGIN